MSINTDPVSTGAAPALQSVDLPTLERELANVMEAAVLLAGGGEIRVERPRVRWKILDAWQAAAAEVGAPPDLVNEIRAAETARFAAERLAELNLAVAFHRALAERAIRSLRQRYPGPHRLSVLACNFEGVPIVTVEEHELA